MAQWKALEALTQTVYLASNAGPLLTNPRR